MKTLCKHLYYINYNTHTFNQHQQDEMKSLPKSQLKASEIKVTDACTFCSSLYQSCHILLIAYFNVFRSCVNHFVGKYKEPCRSNTHKDSIRTEGDQD